MCGRFAITDFPRAIFDETLAGIGGDGGGTAALGALGAWGPRYNIVPTQSVPVFFLDPEDGAPRLEPMRWGLIPSWAKDPSIGNRMINARSETVHEKPSFRAAFRSRRCLVPASGFFEWSAHSPDPRGAGEAEAAPREGRKGQKQPYWVTVGEASAFAMAGLWEEWTDPQGRAVRSFTILTCPASDDFAAFHHRMPVILPPARHADWLRTTGSENTDAALALLRPLPVGSLRIRPISTRVNNPRHDDPSILAPAHPKDASPDAGSPSFGTGSLFGEPSAVQDAKADRGAEPHPKGHAEGGAKGGMGG